MSQFKFVIPQKLEDLSHPLDDANIFYVNDELTPMEIEHKIAETESKLKNDPLDITTEFNVYYSVLKNFLELDPRMVDRFFVILYRATSSFKEQLREIFAQNAQATQQTQTSQQTANRSQQIIGSIFESNEEKQQCSNALKMLLYLCCSFTHQFEDHLASQSHRKNFEDKIGGTKRKKNQTAVSFVEYERFKTRVMKELLHLISMPLSKVADSPTEARDIAGQVMKVCHKIVENSAINNLTKDADLVDICFSTLGIGVEKYNQSLSFCLKLIQLLQQREQLAPLLAELVESIVTKHDQRLLVGEILREIDRIDIRELSRDSSCPRAVSTFLVALSEKCPREFIQSIDHMFTYLERDSYIMRNASLSIMANLIIQVLHQEEEDKTLRDEILDALLAHICDITGYTRSRALSLWCVLSEKQIIPLTYLLPVMTAAVGRFQDKVCLVRKNAVRFITNMLIRNPFAPIDKFSLQEFVERYKLEKLVLEKLLKEEDEKINKDQEVLETLSQESDTSHSSQADPNAANRSSQMKNLVLTEESASVLQQRKVKFLHDIIAFTRQIHNAIPMAAQLLKSKNITDTQESIDFFVICHEFSIDEAMIGFKEMILLILHEEKSIRDAVVSAYKRIFFQSIRYEGKSNKNLLIVTTLINFVKSATIGECICMEKLISEFLESGDFKKDMEFELWAIFTRVKPTTTTLDACAAIQLIGMIASSQPDTINQNLTSCNKYGFATRGLTPEDSMLVRETCIAIRKALPRKVEDRYGCRRFMPEHELFVSLEAILVESITELASEHWLSMCDEAIKLIFDFAELPQKICESILFKISERLHKGAQQCSQVTDTTDRESPDLFQAQNLENVQPIALARFIHFLGTAALTLCIFLETTVLYELKARNAPSGDTSAHNISVHNISISSRRRSRRYANKSLDEDKGLEEEVGLGGAEAEDVELEFIERLCDEEVVCGESLLAQMSGLIIEVCQDPRRYYQPELKRSSTLALGKFMIVSAKFCYQHLRLLFTILEKTTDNCIKTNLLIVISDLCIRFPNQLDGWTGKIFDCLQSDDIIVRRTALKLLSRLVLGDILKAKDQISTMANLIVDDDEIIASQARRFFMELSKKVNAIYNILPDIISRLSDAKTGIDEERFRKVMKFLFDLIDKSQHIDRLVDKLCGRFMETDNERHWSDLAFCLSLLKHSDRSISKLIEKYDCYKDKLCIDSVRESISTTVANYKKLPNVRAEMKQTLDEFEAKIAQ